MSALDEYNRIWDMLAQTHRQTHGDDHAPTRDFNCCGEFAVMMALRAASSLRPDYPPQLLLRMAAMPELDRDFYVKNLLSTDGEAEPADPEPLREYRAARRYHILWTELKEAAALDGASGWRQFRHVTLPLMAPIIVALSSLEFIWNFNSFGLVYVLTEGGPAGLTRLPMLFAYFEGFQYGNLGYAAALGNVMVLIIGGFVLYGVRRQGAATG